MSTSVAYFGTPEHTQDLAAMASTPGAQLTPRIANYEASADEVLQWYGSEDPVNEDLNWGLVRNLASSNFSLAERRQLQGDRITHHIKVNESAALTMLLSTAGVSEGGEPGKPWSEAGHPIVDKHLAHNPDLLAGELIDLSLERPGIDQFDKLYVALDSLQVAALGLHNIAIEGREGRIELQPSYVDYIDRSLRYRSDAMRLGTSMIQRIDQLDMETAKTARSMLHRLSTLMCGMSIENVHAFVDFDSAGPLTTVEKQNFNYLTHLIEYSFLELHEGKTVKGSEKGDLHELLYLLDTNFLFATGGSVARKWYGIASADRHDAPKVGYPSKKRGLDFVFTNNFRAKLVQLKSSKLDESEYHPWILKIQEENFQEVDKRRLGAKLHAYHQWIESDFDPALEAKVDKYILPSARQTFDAMLREGSMSQAERIIEACGDTLTRAEKRRIMRNCGEFKKRRQPNRK